MNKYDLKDLTRGPLAKQILMFSLPLMVSNLLQVLFNMSDVAVVGRFAGSRALGSVGSTTTFVMLFTGILIGVGSGVNVLVARYYGADDRKGLVETIHTSALVCLAIGVFIMLLSLAIAEPVLRLLQTKEELIDGAVLYLRLYFLGMPAMAMYNWGNAVFSAIGNTKKPLLYLSISGVVNVVLNVIFVVGFHMDVAGVAIASVIAQYLSAVLIVVALLRSNGVYALRTKLLRITPDKAKLILSVGVPAGLQNGIFQLANLFIQAGVNSFDATMVSGNAAAANSDALVFDVMTAFYTACGSFMGQNYGAGNRERVRKSFFISLAYSFIAGEAIGLLLVVFGPQFLSLFTKEAAVIEAGMIRLTIMGICYGFSAFMDCTIAASRSLGRSLAPTVIVLLGSCVFRVIWIYTVFAYFHTIASLYLLYIFSWTITAIAELIYFRKCYKELVLRLPN